MKDNRITNKNHLHLDWYYSTFSTCVAQNGSFLFMKKINVVRVVTLFLIMMMSSLAIGSDRDIGNVSASYEYEHLLTYLIFDLVVLGVLFVIYQVFYKLKMNARH